MGDEITLPELGVTIRLLKLKGGSATVGVDAPREFTVLRGELCQFDPAPTMTPTAALAATA